MAPIYGEVSEGTSDASMIVNDFVARNGVNVFVRVDPDDLPSGFPWCEFGVECGDGFRVYPEECDDGNTVSGDGCDSDCKVETGYACTGGSYNNSLADSCSAYSQCGDGLVSGAEECDDGNTADFDGYVPETYRIDAHRTASWRICSPRGSYPGESRSTCWTQRRTSCTPPRKLTSRTRPSPDTSYIRSSISTYRAHEFWRASPEARPLGRASLRYY